MTHRAISDAELADALRTHLPQRAPISLRDEIQTRVGDANRQRPFPSVLGVLTDADPLARRRSLLVAAAIIMALVLASAAVVGALRWWQRSDSLPGGLGALAYVQQGDLYVAQPDGAGGVLAVHVDGSPLSRPRWSPDGRFVLVQTVEPSILRLDIATGELLRLAGGSYGDVSPDGETLAYLTANGDIAILDMEGRDARVLVPRPDGTEGFASELVTFENDEPLAWSADGRWLVANGAPNLDSAAPFSLIRIDVASGAVTVVASTRDFYQYQSDWSPDSSRLVFAGYSERRLADHVWVTKSDGTESVAIPDPDGLPLHPTWSPDGSWIAYISLDRAARSDALMIVRPDGGEVRRLADEVHEIVGWSSDGQAVAYTVHGPDGDWQLELHLVTVDSGDDRLLPVPSNSSGFSWAAIPPDGRTTLPSLPPVPTQQADPPVRAPASAEPVRPDAAWGGLGFRVQAGDSDCHVGILRFPDRFDVLSPSNQTRTTTPDPAQGGPTVAPQQADYCELPFAPDGSAFVRAPQRERAFEIIGTDGLRLAGPVPYDGTPPRWSPAGGWVTARFCPGTADCGGDFIVRRDGSDRRDLPGPPTWSLDEQVMAVSTSDGTLLVGDGDGTGLHPIGAFPAPTTWAPDGSAFAFVRDGDVWIAKADGNGARNLTRFELGGATGAWWSPTGDSIAVLQGSTMWLISPDGTTNERVGAGFRDGSSWTRQPWAPDWSPDGVWLAIGQQDHVTLVRAGDRHAVHLENAWTPAWSSDGRHLAVVSDDGSGLYSADVMNADGTGRLRASSTVAYPPLTWLR